MTPAQKKALHNKQRKAKKKSRDALDKKVDKLAAPRGISGVKKQKQAALESVVKSGKGVTVIGKPKAGAKDRKKGATGKGAS
jgi:U3 small nucleolar RNA-associated protein MPP10